MDNLPFSYRFVCGIHGSAQLQYLRPGFKPIADQSAEADEFSPKLSSVEVETFSKYLNDEPRPNLTLLRKFTNRNGIECEKSYDFFHVRKIKQIIVAAIISELRKRGKGCT